MVDGGRILAIEVKSKYGKVSDDQQTFLDTVRTAGGLAFIARSVEDVEQELNVYLDK